MMDSKLIREKYIELFEKSKFNLPGKNISWLKDLREDAINQFKKTGLPDTTVEEWNVYPYKNLTNNYFSFADEESKSIDLYNIEPKAPNCIARLIFHNGRMIKLELDKLPEGVMINSLSYFLENIPEVINGKIKPINKHYETRLSNVIDARSQSIVSLNAAFHKDGAVIFIKKNIEVPGYIELLNLTSTECNLMDHMRSVIILEEGSKCNIIEKTLSIPSKKNLVFSSKVTDINLSRNSFLSFIRLIPGDIDNTSINSIHSDIEENAIYNSTSFIFSKGDAREEIRANLNGAKAVANINGLVLGKDKSKNELLTKVKHIAKSTRSNQNVRVILNGKSRGSFQGKIRVEKEADDTVANMSGKSLLLDQLARINAKPELEILADDVSCSHGVTVGSLDPEQLFYLCSRGIPNKEAKKMLISAFSEVVFENLDSALKEIIKKLVLDYHGEY